MKNVHNVEIGVAFRLLFLSLIFVIISTSAKSQCTYQVTHLNGMKTINGVDVTVTHTGVVDSNFAYCPETFPYFIGFTYAGGQNGNGSYVFAFSPPVSAVTFNISGITNVSLGVEEVIVRKNGFHYSIPAAGITDTCDALAVLTAEGNIAGCAGCNVSGWSQTTVPGPVTMLEMRDSIISGLPDGSIFSLFFCVGASNIYEVNGEAQPKIFPNPFVDKLNIVSPSDKQLQFVMYDIVSRMVIQETFIGSASINTDQLPEGLYLYEIKDGTNTIREGKIIKE